MPITCVHIGNFKGIATPCDLQIKPITVFVGANSSGKSSCIHALAALSQTVKITNDTRPLVLDDEFAFVHLGRFIEIIHSRSYEDAIELGINFSGVNYRQPVPDKPTESRLVTDDAKATFRFRSTIRTQETYLESAQWQVGSQKYSAKRFKKTDTYALTGDSGEGPWKTELSREKAFAFSMLPEINVKNPQDLRNFYRSFPLFAAQNKALAELSRTLYLGPFRQSPLRRYPTRGGGPTEVGAMGEATVTMLANEIIQSRLRTHIKQVTKWLDDLGLARKLDVSRVGRSDLFDVSMTLQDGATFPLADLGYGLSQILPVLTQCTFAPRGATLLFEQPEIHLHSLVAKVLADVFIETAKEKGCHIIIETHSPQLVQGFMVRQRSKGGLSPEDFICYKVIREGGESVTHALEFDECGDIAENWEKGISMD